MNFISHINSHKSGVKNGVIFFSSEPLCACLTKVCTIILELSLISHLIQVEVYEAGFLRAELSADSDDLEDIYWE